jgi:hypothetical protein
MEVTKVMEGMADGRVLHHRFMVVLNRSRSRKSSWSVRGKRLKAAPFRRRTCGAKAKGPPEPLAVRPRIAYTGENVVPVPVASKLWVRVEYVAST